MPHNTTEEASPDDDVLGWLHNSNLKSLVPIFEREQLLDFSCFSRLSIPLLQSLQIPLGTIFKLESALKEKRPDLRISLNRDADVKKVASNLFEWIRESQKNIDKNRAKQRPPWLGTTERQRSTVVSTGFPPLDSSNHSSSKQSSGIKSSSSSAAPTSKKREDKPSTPPRLRSITGIVSFPETNKTKKKPKPKAIPPVPRAPFANYPSIDDEILRYHTEREEVVQPAIKEIPPDTNETGDKAEPTHILLEKGPNNSILVNTASAAASLSKKVSISPHKPTIFGLEEKEQSTATLYEPYFEEYVREDIHNEYIYEKEPVQKSSAVSMAIEARERTPKEMVSRASASKKGHPKTIDPFARKVKHNHRLPSTIRSPYVL